MKLYMVEDETSPKLPTSTLPKFNSSPLKKGGWKTTFLLGRLIFRGYVKLPGCKFSVPCAGASNMDVLDSDCQMFQHKLENFGVITAICLVFGGVECSPPYQESKRTC